MPYSEELAARVREILADRHSEFGFGEKKMFGGICFLLNGNMVLGLHRDSLMVRAGEEMAARFLDEPDVRPMDITGRPMKGWATIDPPAMEDDEELARYCEAAVSFVASMPAK